MKKMLRSLLDPVELPRVFRYAQSFPDERLDDVSTALAEQAQACLDREAAARADADQWRAILTEMQTRDLSDAEKTGVPDDATRRALFESLDRPL